jgi:antitoxin component YwqK of YwqJK toxin-antitoxin module
MKNFLLIISLALLQIKGESQEIRISHSDQAYFENTTTFELKNNLPDGTYKVYQDQEKNILEYSGKIINQKRVNTWTWYFETGVKKREIDYSNGLINGSSTSYYPNGNKSVTMAYANGILNGSFTRWFQNGTIKLTGSYSNGNPSGVWKYYKEDGTLLKEEQH